MSKKITRKDVIEQNRTTIIELLSGAGTCRRLNNLNWLRSEISATEPRVLFHMNASMQQPYLDFNNMNNISAAYDYIVAHRDGQISVADIRSLHAMLCANTYIAGGIPRNTPKILEIRMDDGGRMHAPDASMVEYELNKIVYNINHSRTKILNRAINTHYDIIATQPFDDFNKRTARLVMNWVLMHHGYSPIVFNKPSDKRNYIAAIAAAANGRTKEYTEYMTSVMLRTQRQIIRVLTKSRIYL